MIDELQLFRGKDYVINDKITIRQPTLNDICDLGEQRYFNMVSSLCATPSDYKVMLADNCGVDYEKVGEFEFFCMIRDSLSVEDTSIIFGDLDLKLLKFAENMQTKELVLCDGKNNIYFDNTIYTLVVDYLRAIHGFEKKVDIAGNEHAKQYLLDKERRKLQRQTNKKYESMLIPLVSAMVNCEQFKYNHDTVWNLPIYVFMDSVRRIQKLKSYNQLTQGIYAGTIDAKTLSEDSLNWMGSLSKS